MDGSERERGAREELVSVYKLCVLLSVMYYLFLLEGWWVVRAGSCFIVLMF